MLEIFGPYDLDRSWESDLANDERSAFAREPVPLVQGCGGTIGIHNDWCLVMCWATRTVHCQSLGGQLLEETLDAAGMCIALCPVLRSHFIRRRRRS